MNQPGYAFHALAGNVRDSMQSRYARTIACPKICQWESGEAVRVRIEDYHGK
jgi:hypothetical protein